MTETIVLVGCGTAKADQPLPARELYTSTYFSLKRQVAELVGDRWFILSAKHYLLDPDKVVEPYDTTLEDWAGSMMQWRNLLAASIPPEASSWGDVEVVLLAGKDYSEQARRALPDGWECRRPFDDVDGGIGAQMAWLSDRVDELTLEDGDDDREPQVLFCDRCRRPSWHDVVDAESMEGSAFQCSNCSILSKTGQVTIAAAAERGGSP